MNNRQSPISFAHGENRAQQLIRFAQCQVLSDVFRRFDRLRYLPAIGGMFVCGIGITQAIGMFNIGTCFWEKPPNRSWPM